jgi:hypothetical protein
VDNDETASVWAAAAIGLGAAGAAALIAAWVFGDFAEPAPDPWWTRIGTVVLVLMLIGLLRDLRTTLAVATAVAGLGVTVLGVLGFVDQYGRGFPGVATVLTAFGGLAITVAALLTLRHGTPYRWRPPAVVAAVVAFLLVPSVATPLALAVPDLPVDATTAGAAKPAAVPGSVSEIAWSTEIDGQVRDVVPAGAGVVVLLDDGVVALDGETGEVRWRRVRHGAEAVELDASPDGKAVLVQFQPRDLFPVSREVVDAFTGEVRFSVEDDNEEGSPGFISPMTDSSYIGATDDEQEFFGNSLTDGERLWNYPAPDDCSLLSEREAHIAVGAGMLLPLACDEDDGFHEFRYVLVDGATGDVRWEHRIRLPVPTANVDVDAQLAPDGRFLAVGASSDHFMTQGSYAVLDIETGDTLPFTERVELLAGGIGVVRTGDASRLVDVTTGAALSSTDEFRSCAGTDHGAFLASGVVCVDPKLDSFEGMIETGRIELAVGTYEDQELALVPVTLGPPFTRGSALSNILLVAAPGAVVVATALEPVNGGPIRVVGLQRASTR